MRVLEPMRDMTLSEKLYYCLCITKNKYKYSSHGRAADRSLHELDLPANVPDFVNEKLLQNITENIVNEAIGSLDEI